MKRRLPTYAAAVFCAALAAGRAGAQAPAPAGTPGKTSGKEYVLAHASTFNPPPNDTRNPFWPIGWVPTAPVVTATGPAVVALDVKPEQFTVTSISVDYPPLAVINGQVKGVGERLPVSAGSSEFVTIKKIADGVVVLDYRGHELQVSPAIPGAPKRAR